MCTACAHTTAARESLRRPHRHPSPCTAQPSPAHPTPMSIGMHTQVEIAAARAEKKTWEAEMDRAISASGKKKLEATVLKGKLEAVRLQCEP